MDQICSSHFYSSSAMTDYICMPPSSSSLFSTSLPSIINIDPINSSSSSSSYILLFSSVYATISTHILGNGDEDIWRSSSIATPRLEILTRKSS
ncbi:unnamed protein product [Rotaria sordida]|uniref:Uncharacterized protein n=1 Tax=Rotaria sordida TaxID=392033 RepID=A0A819MFL5_9BILA|nr:unnamed protein product [Rotaria sordida]